MKVLLKGGVSGRDGQRERYLSDSNGCLDVFAKNVHIKANHCTSVLRAQALQKLLGCLQGVVSFHMGSSEGALMCLMIMLASCRGP